MMEIILASKSPRRKDLLEQINIKFKIYAKEIDETYDEKLSPNQIVEYLASKKASITAKEIQNCIIIAADTIVELDGEILLKPKDKNDAINMLKKLSGRTHVVYTGISIVDSSKSNHYTTSVSTEVTMKKLTNDEIQFYVETGEPMDKAGSYGIQGIGSLFIDKISGDYFNIVGLPLKNLHEGFNELGFRLLDYIKVNE